MSERAQQEELVKGLPALSETQIEAGDVILFRGRKAMSKLIRFFDDSAINHVALATGADTIVEASPGGVRIVPLATEMANAEYAVVRRSKGVDAAQRAHIVQAAESFQGGLYSYETVVLLAVQIFLGRHIPIPLRKLLGAFVNSAAGTLRRIVEDGRSPLFCSELVWLAYRQANRTLMIPEANLTPDMLIAQAQYFGQQGAGTLLDAGDEELLAERCLAALEPSAASSPAPPADDDLVRSLSLFSDALRASQASFHGDPHRYPASPPLSPDLQPLFSYVGSATTPDDIFRERSILEDLGRVEGGKS